MVELPLLDISRLTPRQEESFDLLLLLNHQRVHGLCVGRVFPATTHCRIAMTTPSGAAMSAMRRAQ
jgi:hypothetical protein